MGPPIGRRLKIWTDSLEARAGISVVVHVLVIAAISFHWWAWWAKPMAAAGTTHGKRAMLLYMPGPPSFSSQPTRKLASIQRPPRKLAVLSSLTPKPPDPSAIDGVPTPVSTASGSDALGVGVVSIVYIQPFPKQSPDMSKLPGGSSGDVVVGVEIDNTGRVASAITKKGLGYGIDEMVIATVEQWIFHPATKDGRPVASEQELRFHYQLGHDPMQAGWESFALVVR